jgi:hypothetical protein
MMSQWHKVVLVISGVIALSIGCFLVWHKKATEGLTGCNLCVRNLYETGLADEKATLDRVLQDTNSTPDKIEFLKQSYQQHKALFDKWDAHVKKYGHVHKW